MPAGGNVGGSGGGGDVCDERTTGTSGPQEQQTTATSKSRIKSLASQFEQAAKVSEQPASEAAVCKLTARTRTKQCALHGDRKLSSASADASSALATTTTLAATTGAQIASEPRDAKRRKKGKGRGKRRSNRVPLLASWPLARHQLCSHSFGDCEHMQRERSSTSAALSSWHCQAGSSLESNLRLLDCSSGANALAGCLRTAAKAAGSKLDERQEEDKRDPKHRRPFGQPYERPVSGWLANSLGLARSRALKGKLLPLILIRVLILIPIVGLLFGCFEFELVAKTCQRDASPSEKVTSFRLDIASPPPPPLSSPISWRALPAHALHAPDAIPKWSPAHSLRALQVS